MKKSRILVIILALLLSLVLFSGCKKNLLYNTWQLQEIVDAETKEGEEPMFANMMVFTINKDGTVYFMDSLFGTYEMDRNEFTFTYEQDEDDSEENSEEDSENTPEQVTGAWEIIGSELYIYPDSDPVYYYFAAVETTEDEEE
jgi:hypothetical protein